VRWTLVQGVGPQSGRCPGRGEGGVVPKTKLGKDREHCVTSSLQEGCSHPSDIAGVHVAELDEQLGLSYHLLGPPVLVKGGGVGVGDRVRSNLMTLGVKILDLTIVSPLVGNVESGSYTTAIWIGPAREQPFVEVFVQVVHSIIKSNKYKLGSLFRQKTSWGGEPTGAGGQLAGKWAGGSVG